MNTVRDEYTTIVGVDTHARTNTYALLEAASGRVVDTATFPTSPPGLARAITWIDRRRTPGRTLVAIEGTNSYGATLTRALAGTDLEVCQLRPPRRASRAGRGASDDIDALAAARTVLAEDVSALLQPRAGGNRQALRILLNARDAIQRHSTADRLSLTAMVRTLDLGIDARTALTDAQITQISRWRTHAGDDLPTRIARAEAKRLATAITDFQTLVAQNRQQLIEVVDTMAPGLMDLPGLGPVTAAQVLLCYSHHGRVRSEAAFAALAASHPDSGFLGPHRPAPAQPLRRPAAEPGAAHDRQNPHDVRPRHQGLRCPARYQGEKPPGDPPLPQTIHRPSAVQEAANPLDVDHRRVV